MENLDEKELNQNNNIQNLSQEQTPDIIEDTRAETLLPVEGIEQKKQKIKAKLNSFFKNNYSTIFLVIFVLGIIIRLYYFSITKSQPLWWDESDYMAFAKNLAGFNVDWIVSPQHNSIFPYIIAIFFKLGLSETTAKFFLELVPSILIIYLTYKICILMYKDKRIALITTFLITTFWNILFNSFRFHLGIPALFTAFLAIYVFFQGYEKKQKIFGKINPNWAIPITVLLVLLTYSIRRGYFLFGFFFLFYMLSTRKFKHLLKDKYNWIALAIALIVFFFLETFLFVALTQGVAGSYYRPEVKLTFDALKIIPTYFNSLSQSSIFHILKYLFWIGLAYLGFNTLLSFNYFKKQNFNSDIKSDLFNLLSIIITFAFFICITRISMADGSIGDPRWYFPFLLGGLICISRASLLIADSLKKYHRYLGIVIIVLLLAFAGYGQVQHADQTIKGKINSYQGIKNAGIYLNKHSNADDIIVSVPVPQTAYYAERVIANPGALINKPNMESTIEDFLIKVRENPKINYILVSFSEPNHPIWMRKESEEHTGIWRIPFMDTKINIATGEQDIKQEKTYGDITFRLLEIKDEIFIYEIIRK